VRRAFSPATMSIFDAASRLRDGERHVLRRELLIASLLVSPEPFSFELTSWVCVDAVSPVLWSGV